jgi:excisionase family DNA binding protein
MSSPLSQSEFEIVLHSHLDDDELKKTIAEVVCEILDARMGDISGTRTSEWITVEEAAQILGLAKKTIYAMFADGRLTRHGTRGRALVAIGEVHALALGTPHRVSGRGPSKSASTGTLTFASRDKRRGS